MSGREHGVQGALPARQQGRGQLGDQLPFPGLHRYHPGPAHHVVRGDSLEQRALQPLPPGHDEVRSVPGQPAAAGGRSGP